MNLNLGEILHQEKQDLRSFWNQFGGKKENGIGYFQEDKLNSLKRMVDKVYFYRTKSLVRYRKKFNERYKNIWKLPCFVCSAKANHRHHIILLSHGGLNSKLNRIPLCSYCHSLIHPWMQTEWRGRSVEQPGLLQ